MIKLEKLKEDLKMIQSDDVKVSFIFQPFLISFRRRPTESLKRSEKLKKHVKTLLKRKNER